jgi:predicted DNA binding CopG/RHH family protein
MDENNIFGCFISHQPVNFDDEQKIKEISIEQGKLFNFYIWGDNGISNILKLLKRNNYGSDFNLILFQFKIKPFQSQMQLIKEVENYRRKDKSIGINIIINDSNFFDKSESDRKIFLKKSIIQGFNKIDKVIRRNKLDTNFEKLSLDLENILKNY